MALLFIDSFDHYVTADLTEKWSVVDISGGGLVTIGATNGRRSSAGLRSDSTGGSAAFASKTLTPAGTTALLGCAVRVSELPLTSTSFLAILDGAVPQVFFRVTASGAIEAWHGSGGTNHGTSSVVFTANAYVYLEIRVVISTTVGQIEIRAGGTTVLSLTNKNTQNTGAVQWTGVRLGYAGGHGQRLFDFDDLYVLDGSGVAPWNAFLGDVRVDVRLPTAPGASAAFTPSAGANWQNVDDVPPNDDTDHNSSPTVGATDTFVTQDAPVPGAAIFGVQHCLNVKKLDAGTCTVAPVIRHGGTDFPGANLSPGTSYAYGLQIAQTNPGTGAQWTEAGFNAAEFGYRKTG